jgi:hypothetical protein
LIYRRLEGKQSGAVHAPVHTRKSADYSVPKKTRAPTTDMHRWGLVHAMYHAAGFIFSLAL